MAGSYLWIWRGEDVGSQIKGKGTAEPVGCDGSNIPGDGPCDLKEVFPASLAEHDGNTTTGETLGTTPDGKYLVVALRGPIPVSVGHNAQGSCPGVGIIALRDNGASGKLVAVLRSTNTVDDAPAAAPGGHAYTGAEHSDPHGASVRARVEDQQ